MGAVQHLTMKSGSPGYKNVTLIEPCGCGLYDDYIQGPPPSLLNRRKWNIYRYTYNLVHPHLDGSTPILVMKVWDM